MWRTCLRIVLLLVVFTHPKANATIRNFVLKFNPIPDDIMPDEYYLTIIINTNSMSDFYYKGHVLIQFHCEQQTKRIVLNQYELSIDTAKIKVFVVENGIRREIRIIDQFKTETEGASDYEIILEEDLLKGQHYETTMWFYKLYKKSSRRGIMKHEFFNNWYRNKKISTTNSVGRGARDLFPCFDEIHMKAKFHITVKHDNTVQGLSNSVLDSTTQNSDFKRETFKGTERIATFSVAIAFLDVTYQHKESIVSLADFKISSKMFYKIEDSRLFNKFDTTHRIICDVIEYFTKIFNLPLKKLDIVIMPNNIIITSYYGFIFMSEKDAMAFVYETRISEKYKLFSEVCRAICQQWIGNIVTMSQWFKNWLFQGFCRFLQVSCVNKFLPDSENRVSQLEIVNSFLQVLEAESEGRHSPILLMDEPRLEYLSFNEETRNKVYHLIRMMNFFLGSEIFQQGVKKFVERMKYKVSTVTDVWHAFTIAAEEAKIGKTEILPDELTVEEIIETWMNQNGLPIISVTRNDDSSVTIEQNPFPSSHKMEQVEPKKKCWIIPLSFTTKTEHEFENVGVRKWLTCDTSSSVTITHVPKNEWILFNLNMNVLGRVNYDEDNWRRIKESLLYEENYSGIDVSTRVHLISDMFALAEIGEIPYDILFDTMKYLNREEHYAVWKVAATAFKKIWIFLRGTKLLELFEDYVQKVLEPIFKKEGYNFNNLNDLSSNDGEVKNLLKQLILELSCKFNMDICRKISKAFIENWKKWPQQEWSSIIPININKAIHCQGVKYGNASYRKKLRSHYLETSDSNDYEIILAALSCAQSSGTLERHLKINILPSTEERSTTALKNLVTNKNGYHIMKKNFSSVLKTITKLREYDYAILRSYLYILLDTTNNQEDLNKVLTFADDLKGFISIDYESIHFEKAHKNIRWLGRYKEELRLYLNKQKKK